MRVGAFVCALLSSVCFSASSLAATVQSKGGQVLVNKGEGYRQVVGSVDVKAGDSILVNPGGSGQITFSDGCAVDIGPGSVITISPQSPCLTTGSTSNANANANASAGSDGGSSVGGMSTTTFAIGAAVVGGGVAAAALLLGQSSDKPASN